MIIQSLIHDTFLDSLNSFFINYSDPTELPQGCYYWVWIKSDDPTIKKLGELNIRGMYYNYNITIHIHSL